MNNNILTKTIKEKTLLPNRVFNDNILFIKAFEPTLIQEVFFFEKLVCFLKKCMQKEIIAGELIGDLLFTLDVNNVNYDYWTSKVFSVEGLFYTEIGITSETANWGIYLDNVDFEIGLVGFYNSEQEKLFLDTFEEDRDVFMTLKDYIADMDLMLNFSNEAKEKYNSIIKNHTSYIL